MLKYFLIIMSVFSLHALAQTQCEQHASNLKAEYKIITTRGDSQSTSQVVLWRNNNSVAHQYPQSKITQAWTLVRNKLIKPVRYFDQHQRAIEYQPGERIHGHTERDFSYRYQLISDTLLNKMTLTDTSGEGCDTHSQLTYQHGDAVMEVTWLPELKLIKQFRVTENNVTREWILQNLDYSIDTKEFFAKRDAYKSTDFADIGDDHTDPFLTKMVTQGFIEPAASGFYDQHGNAMAGHSHAH